MPATVIVGAQWGDEGKGKITDMLAATADVVARFQGGDNAGHTVVHGSQTFKLHHIPSGILYPRVTCILGNGMVINPKRLLEELDGLASRGVDTSNLLISGGAHLIMPYHIALDGAAESQEGTAIGTTKRGVGPAYTDKAARVGIRVQDMLDEASFAEKVRCGVRAKNAVLEGLYDLPPFDPDAVAEEYLGYARRLVPYVADTSLFLDQAFRAGKKVRCEGAQGTLLDVDHGTYPFITGSSLTAGSATAGLGFGPHHIERVFGVAKAYQTRVGRGPFPTELTGEIGDALREAGHEYGTTTGRPRRCGWLDAVTLRYAARLNGLTSLAVTKLDVLTGLDPLRIGVAYRLRGQRLEHIPLRADDLAACQPVYEDVPGWQEDISAARTMDELPPAARAYLRRMEELSGVPVSIVSVGPEREQTIRV